MGANSARVSALSLLGTSARFGLQAFAALAAGVEYGEWFSNKGPPADIALWRKLNGIRGAKAGHTLQIDNQYGKNGMKYQNFVTAIYEGIGDFLVDRIWDLATFGILGQAEAEAIQVTTNWTFRHGKQLLIRIGKVTKVIDGDDLKKVMKALPPGGKLEDAATALEASLKAQVGNLQRNGDQLRAAMKAKGLLAEGEAAHHLISVRVAQKSPFAEVAKGFGYDINNINNGVSLPTTIKAAKAAGKPLHSGGHIAEYYREVEKRLGEIDQRFRAAAASGFQWGKDKVLAEMRALEDSLRRDLLDPSNPLKLQVDDPIKP